MSCRSFAPIVPARSLLRLRATVVLTLLLGCNPSSKSSDETDVSGDSGDDTGEEVEDVEEVPSASNPWVRDERAAPGSITFNEIYYHPSSDDQAEWLELYNPMALDMDLSGWSLEGGVRVTFPEGTVVAAGGYLVVAADPAALPGALGPFEGRLNNDGERVNLYNNSGRLIDTVAYGDDDPWPVAADGSGLSLAKIRPDTMSDRAEGWSASATLGGTPGQSNLLDPNQSTCLLYTSDAADE